jgi:hypothetical protein
MNRKAANARNCELRLGARSVADGLGKRRFWEGSKKFEQDTSGGCQKSEYLTLLNTSPNAKTRDRQGIDEYHLR